MGKEIHVLLPNRHLQSWGFNNMHVSTRKGCFWEKTTLSPKGCLEQKSISRAEPGGAGSGSASALGLHRPPVPAPARARKAEGGNQNGSVTFTGYRQLECSLTPALRMKASAHERQALTNLLTRTKKKKKPRTHQKTHCGLQWVCQECSSIIITEFISTHHRNHA